MRAKSAHAIYLTPDTFASGEINTGSASEACLVRNVQYGVRRKRANPRKTARLASSSSTWWTRVPICADPRPGLQRQLLRRRFHYRGCKVPIRSCVSGAQQAELGCDCGCGVPVPNTVCDDPSIASFARSARVGSPSVQTRSVRRVELGRSTGVSVSRNLRRSGQVALSGRCIGLFRTHSPIRLVNCVRRHVVRLAFLVCLFQRR